MCLAGPGGFERSDPRLREDSPAKCVRSEVLGGIARGQKWVEEPGSPRKAGLGWVGSGEECLGRLCGHHLGGGAVQAAGISAWERAQEESEGCLLSAG